jgi:hypothetical protein
MENDDPYIEDDLFPRLEGRRMCPRCIDCEVGVGSYWPPFEGAFGGKARLLPPLESLRPEPSDDPSGEPEAWYCKGACNDKGEHSRRPVPPSFIGRVRKAR